MTAETSVPSTAMLAAAGGDRDSSNYTARHLLVLEGLEAVRKRPGMYIGSTDSRGLMHCLWEIIDNSVDEALGGYCDQIEVILHDDASVEVRDNGRGIPVDVEPKTGLSGVEVVSDQAARRREVRRRLYAASGGLHGVGASVVNALSARLDVEVDRSSATHSISFRRGVPGMFTEQPDSPFDPANGLRKGKRVPKTRTGTRVRYWADRQIFLKDAKLNLETLYQRARQTAFLVPGLTIIVRDERGLDGEGKTEETFRFDGGISEFCEYLAQDKAVCDVQRLSGTGTFKETVPVLDDRGHMTATEVTRELGVDIALRWGTGYDTTVRSFVNIIATPKGGTHVTGFERSLTKTVNEALRSAKMLRVAEDDVVKDDALEGLTAVVTVRLAEPQFEGQTKEVLGTSAANRIVANVVAKELKSFLTSTKRDAKAQARAVLEKAVAAARTRIAARQHKDAQRRKTALESSSLPAKLADCRSDDVDRSELFIVEGDSALGTAKLARNSEFQRAAADPRQDPQRPEVVRLRHAEERRMRRDHPGHRSRFRADLRPRRRPLREDRPAGGRRRRRCPHPLSAADPLPALHAPDGRGGTGLRRGAPAAPDRAGPAQEGPGQVRLHLLRQRTAPDPPGVPAQEHPDQGVDPALLRASARWTPTSWPRRRWTRATAHCGASTSATWNPPSRSSIC